MNRAAVFLTDGDLVLTCHAPNRPSNDYTYDLPKGHIEENEDIRSGALRELFEETGLTYGDIAETVLYEEMSAPLKYGADTMYVLIIRVSELPPTSRMHCDTMFNWYGRILPEVSSYEYFPMSALFTKLYKSLVAILPKVVLQFGQLEVSHSQQK